MTATSPNPHLSDRSQVLFAYPLTLATRGAIQVYNRTFRRVDAALYLAQIIVRVQGEASRQFTHEIDQVNTALDDELRRLEDTLATQRGWMTKRRAAAPAADAEGVIYTDPATATLALRTPKARRYARLLTALDQALQHLDRAWYDDAIGDDERLDRSATLIRGFHRACGAIERLARGLAQRVRAEDGATAPNATYQAMLIKRTGRGAGEAPPAPPDTDAEWPMMTATEAAGLEDMEQMAAALTRPASAAEEPSLATAEAAPAQEAPLATAEAASAPVVEEPPLAIVDVASAPAAEEPPLATAEAVLESPSGKTEAMPDSAAAAAALNAPRAETEAISEAPAATTEATLEPPRAKTDALPPEAEVIVATEETASETASTQKTPPAPLSPAHAPKASRFDDLMNRRMTA
ncbi:MAG: hypothetical protein KDJ70_12015 [Candidatus Competibacteraceae bacterium]|nr:hypothetical protein [Candidatus Competibacteraceae bacterium]